MCLKSLCFCELYFVHYPSYRANVSLVSLISLVTGQILCISLVRSSLLGLGMKQKMIEAFVLNMDNLRLPRDQEECGTSIFTIFLFSRVAGPYMSLVFVVTLRVSAVANIRALIESIKNVFYCQEEEQSVSLNCLCTCNAWEDVLCCF